jgi:hypothetical protein
MAKPSTAARRPFEPVGAAAAAAPPAPAPEAPADADGVGPLTDEFADDGHAAVS